MGIKSILRRWEQGLEEILTDFYYWMQDRRKPRQPSYDEFILLQKLEEKERDIKYLQFQLTKVRADNTELQLRRNELFSVFEQVLGRSNDQLRQDLRFSVQRTEDETAWETVTEHCCLGGCDMGVCTFSTERDALLFAALLSAVEYQPSHNTACPDCYAEYMKDCI